MPKRHIAARTWISLPLCLMPFLTSVAMADDFPSVKGTWAGSYKVAFPSENPTLGDQSADTEMQLEVYKQDGNLIWVINRWRRAESTEWITESGTGSFDLEDTSDLVIAEYGPTGQTGVNTGSFIGRVDDGDMYLNYIGPGMGVTFSVKLTRQD